MEDLPAFNEVWSDVFGGRIPATVIVPTSDPGFIIPEERIEINTIALRNGSGKRFERCHGDLPQMWPGHPHAVRCGDLLLFSGIMAIDEDGIVLDGHEDQRQPYFGSCIKSQMRYILAKTEEICRAAGTSLSNVCRIQQFHSDLEDFFASTEVWAEFVGDLPLPISAVEVRGPAPYPSCVILLDLWVYAPEVGA